MFTFPITMMSSTAGSSFYANAVTFDGTNDYLSRGAGLTGAADSKLITGSLWLKATSSASYKYIIDTPTEGITLFKTNSDKIVLEGYDSGFNQVVGYTSVSTIITSWKHILFSFDLTDTAKRHFYINDTSDGGTWNVYSNTNMDNTTTEFVVGDTVAHVQKYTGDMAELWLTYGTYIDFSNSTNRRKFISATGKPVSLGADGSTPTGTAPIIYLANPTSTWKTNLGSGGGFTETGALTTASTSPSD